VTTGQREFELRQVSVQAIASASRLLVVHRQLLYQQAEPMPAGLVVDDTDVCRLMAGVQPPGSSRRAIGVSLVCGELVSHSARV
jgi:hypothetical protein